MAKAQAEAESSAEKLHGIVARGRSLLAPDPVKRKLVGYDADGKRAITAPVMVEYLPGAEVELPADELLALRQSGYIVDPGKGDITRVDGSTYRVEAAAG